MNYRFINNFDSLLPRFIPENSSFKVKYLALMNTILPQLYTIIISTSFFLSNHETVYVFNTMLVIIYLIFVLGFILWIRYLKKMNRELYDKISRTQDYTPIDETDPPLYGTMNNDSAIIHYDNDSESSGSYENNVNKNNLDDPDDPLSNIIRLPDL